MIYQITSYRTTSLSQTSTGRILAYDFGDNHISVVSSFLSPLVRATTEYEFKRDGIGTMDRTLVLSDQDWTNRVKLMSAHGVVVENTFITSSGYAVDRHHSVRNDGDEFAYYVHAHQGWWYDGQIAILGKRRDSDEWYLIPAIRNHLAFSPVFVSDNHHDAIPTALLMVTI